MQVKLLLGISSGAVNEGPSRSILLHRDRRWKFCEGEGRKQSVISGIEIELVVEVLGLSRSKVVVVARSKQGLARSQHSGDAKMVFR
jgi:hypothetical protein